MESLIGWYFRDNELTWKNDRMLAMNTETRFLHFPKLSDVVSLCDPRPHYSPLQHPRRVRLRIFNEWFNVSTVQARCNRIDILLTHKWPNSWAAVKTPSKPPLSWTIATDEVYDEAVLSTFLQAPPILARPTESCVCNDVSNMIIGLTLRVQFAQFTLSSFRFNCYNQDKR